MDENIIGEWVTPDRIGVPGAMENEESGERAVVLAVEVGDLTTGFMLSPSTAAAVGSDLMECARKAQASE